MSPLHIYRSGIPENGNLQAGRPDRHSTWSSPISYNLFVRPTVSRTFVVSSDRKPLPSGLPRPGRFPYRILYSIPDYTSGSTYPDGRKSIGNDHRHPPFWSIPGPYLWQHRYIFQLPPVCQAFPPFVRNRPQPESLLPKDWHYVPDDRQNHPYTIGSPDPARHGSGNLPIQSTSPSV